MWETEDAGTPRKVSVDERRALIVEEVNNRSSIRVSDICEHFGVSEVTARTDLDRLEKAGKLRRTHGGASSITRTITVSYPDQRMNINVEAKRAIAEHAAGFVSNGDSILVDTGTTTIEFVRCLYDKRGITIVTSDLSIATFADSNLPHADVLLLGGALRKNHRYITGTITNEILGKLYLDKAFMATDSFHPDFGFTTEFTGNADVKSAMLKRSRRHFMLMDASKVRHPSFIRFAQLSDFDGIVMDDDPDGAVERAIADAGVSTRLFLAHGGAPMEDEELAVDALDDEAELIGRQRASHVGRAI